MLFAGGLSAFVNNTAAVAMFMPMVLLAARDTGVGASRLLMPLSFASMFGGVCTLVGTSTNILVSTIAVDHGMPAFGMFEFLPLGIIFFVVGTVYMLTVGIRLIPERRAAGSLTETFGMGDYLAEIELLGNAESVGRRLLDSPLVKDIDLDVLEIRRKGDTVILPLPDVILRAGDVLRVRGNVNQIQRMQEQEGIRLGPSQGLADVDLETDQSVLIEAVIPPGSELEGRTLQGTAFRNRFDATVLAIRHRGELLRQRLRSTALLAGDALLIEARTSSLPALRRSSALVLVSEVRYPETRSVRMVIAIAIMVAVILVAALNLAPIAVSASIGAVAMLAAGCLTPHEAYEDIDWQVIFLIAGVLALGFALEKTGGARLLSEALIRGVGPFGPGALLGTIYFITMLLTSVMSNNAAAVLIAPVALAAAASVNADPRPFLMAVTFAASASFMTPVGYQTNTMVFAAGGYRFTDFTRVGAPLNLLMLGVAVVMVPWIWG
jgi:di/tricarboxylate transporter